MKPGLAQETLRELAPLLAEEAIDVDSIDVPDLASLQAALDRAVERHNMTASPLFPNPVAGESILDRVINTSHHLLLEGKSYRPRRRPGHAAPAARNNP